MPQNLLQKQAHFNGHNYLCIVACDLRCHLPGSERQILLGSHIIDVPTTVKEARLHFFLHDTISGANPSSILVAKPNNIMFLNKIKIKIF
ncbi:hypothetical protein R6Q59_005255 [Mikania micrantha]